jgi:endonuclease YncB( thermonuclease family)
MKKNLCVFLLIFVVVMSLSATFNRNGITFSWDYNYLRPINYEDAVVIKNIDGDTIKVSIKGKEENVRLIGVDTPETVHPSKPVEEFGKEASDFTKAMCPVGSTVYLTYDWKLESVKGDQEHFLSGTL